jgi:hypothetical protein
MQLCCGPAGIYGVLHGKTGFAMQNLTAQKRRDAVFEPRKGLKRYPFARRAGQKIQAESPVSFLCARRKERKCAQNTDLSHLQVLVLNFPPERNRLGLQVKAPRGFPTKPLRG